MASLWALRGCGLLCLVLSLPSVQPLEIFDSVITARRLDLVKFKALQWEPFLRRLNDTVHNKADVNAMCRAHMQLFIDAMVQRDVPGLQLLDSQGSFPTGMLHGSSGEIGSQKECFAAALADNNGDPVGKKFCSVVVYHTDRLPNFPQVAEKEQKKAKVFAFEQSMLKIGACLPSACSNEDVEKILSKALSEWKASSFISACDHNQPTEEPSVFIIIILGAFITAVGLATALDVINRTKPTLLDQASSDANSAASGKSLLARFQSLSVLEAVRSTFSMDGGKGDRLDIFNGLRVLALVWVVTIHTYIYMDDSLIDSMNEMYKMSRTFARQFIVNASMSVAIFMTVGGFMQWMTVSKRTNDEHGSATYFVLVFRRYLRLFPLVAVTACFHQMVPVSGYGPLWAFFSVLRRKAFPENWPYYILGILNFLALEGICSPQHWYTASDFQVFAIMLYFSRRLKRTGSFKPILVILGLSNLITYLQNHMQDLGPGLLYYAALGKNSEAGPVYYMPYTHIPSYCIGIIAGYYYTKQPSRKLSRRKVMLLWMAALASIGISLFGTILWTGHELPSRTATALYAATTRSLFSSGLAWIIYACLTDRAGFLTSVLAWPGWAPMSRLSFSIYIIHDFILYYQWINFPGRVDGGYYFMMTVVAGNCAASFVAAFALHAVFERPIALMASLLEERCFPKRHRHPSSDGLAVGEAGAAAKRFTARGRGERTKRL
ncbi:nose resistant to fluoxetine protein 6-like [Amblyomma americanum]